MSYRKFKILNGRGNEFELTNQDIKVFANNPQGLGYTKTISTIRLGDELLELYKIFNLDEINFEILFYDDTKADKYQKYVEFVNFLSFKPLYLLYQRPNSFDWYRRKIEVLGLSKTEVSSQDSMLHCDMILQTLSFWEDNETQIVKVSNDISGGKIYPITYPINYGLPNLSNINGVGLGFLDTPLEITISGVTTNPEYIIYDANDEIYGRTKFVGTFDSVYVNSKESEEEIKLIYNDLVLDNPLGYQDLTVGNPNNIYVTFLKMKTGQNKLAFLLGNSFDGEVEIKWRNRYVTV